MTGRFWESAPLVVPAASPVVPMAGSPPPAKPFWEEAAVVSPPPVVAAAPPEPHTFSQGMAEAGAGMADALSAAGQRTSPIVRDLGGKLNYKPVGEFGTWDAGTGFMGPDGRFSEVNPTKHVVLRDPQSGRQMVFERDKSMDEGIMSSLGRFLTFGATAPAPVAGAKAPSVAANLLKDFEAHKVDPSLPAVTQSRTIGTLANVLKEAPIAADIMTARGRTTRAQTYDAVNRTAGLYGEASTPREAGDVVKTAIQRFIHGDSPGYIDPASVIARPTRATSFDTKAGVLYDRLNGHFPQQEMIDVRNIQTALGTPIQRWDNPDLAKQFVDPTLSKWGEIIDKSGGVLSWNDMKNFRSEIGKLIRKPEMTSDVDRAQLERLYGAFTDDMRTAAAAKGPGALRDFERANDYYAAGMKRIKDALQVVDKAASPEAAFDQVKGASEGTRRANAGRLYALRRSMAPEEWGDVASTFIHNLGKPTPGAADPLNGTPFNASNFVTRYAGLTDEAKDVLFNMTGNAEAKKSLDSLVRVVSAQKNVERLANPSGTARIGAQVAAIGGAFGAPAETLMALLGGTLSAGAMMNPTFTRWMIGAQQAMGTPAFASHVVKLDQIVQRDPTLTPVAQALREAFGRAPRPAAADGDGREPQR